MHNCSEINRYQNVIIQSGHPIALVSIVTTLCEKSIQNVSTEVNGLSVLSCKVVHIFTNGTAIPRVQRHVHLGMTITSDLRWNDHVATVLKKVAPALHLSLTLAYRHQLPPAVIRKFYDVLIRPGMEYCNAVWCGASAHKYLRLDNEETFPAISYL